MTTEKPRGFMSNLPEGTYTRTQVARLIGKSRDTIRRWHKDGRLVPSREEPFGTRHVYLYTEDDLIHAHRLAREVRPGPQRKGA